MLTPYVGQTRKIRFCAYDLEWYPHTMQLRLAGIFDGSRYYSYDTMAEFLDSWLDYRHRGTVFFAHAGGLADVQFVLIELFKRKDNRFRADCVFSGSSAIIVRVSDGKNSWVFVDSLWLLKSPLSVIATALGTRKTDSDYRCAEYDPAREDGDRCVHQRSEEKCVFYAPSDILRDYNENDCRILYEAIDRFQDELIDMGSALRFTVSSCAMRLFRSSYLKAPILTDSDVNDFSRMSYNSSRTEPFRKHCENAEYYDINSSFSFSMVDPDLPGSPIAWTTKRPKRGPYLSECNIEVPDMYLPPLPYRHDGRVFFPVGRWRGWFNNIDLELLESVGGTIHNHYRSVTFEPRDDLADYVRDIYSIRKNASDGFSKLLWKFMLNALYGKFAENSLKERVVWNPVSLECPHGGKHVVDGRSLCVRMIQPGLFAIADEVEVPHMHVPLSSHITALARKALYGWLSMARESSPIYYCDCDSVVTKAHLPTGLELGELKKEYHIDRGVFLAPKLYRIEHPPDKEGGTITIRAKGFPRLRPEQFDALENGGNVEYNRMLRLREVFRKGLENPAEILTSKGLHNVTPKRVSSGNDSRPWHLEELERESE